jgi:hypothetical protein
MTFSKICDQKKCKFCSQKEKVCAEMVVSIHLFEFCVQKKRNSCTQFEKSLPIPTDFFKNTSGKISSEVFKKFGFKLFLKLFNQLINQ